MKMLRKLLGDAPGLTAIYGDGLGWRRLARSRPQLLLGFSCTQGPIGPGPSFPAQGSSERPSLLQISPWNPGSLSLGRHRSSASPSVQSRFLSVSSTLVHSQEQSLTNVWQTHLHLRVCFVGKPNHGSWCQECSKEQMLTQDFRAGSSAAWLEDAADYWKVYQGVIQVAAPEPDVIVFARVE